MRPDMRVLVLTHGGAETLLDRLAALDGVVVAGVFIETARTRRRPPAERIRRSLRYDGALRTGLKLGRLALQAIAARAARAAGLDRAGSAAAGAGDALEAHAASHGIAVHRVPAYDAPDAIAFMAATRPDLGIAWGTGILAPAVFQLPRLGTINFHQGHTPYYRGGPSVFWELFNGETQIGLTIHHVAAAVDAGDVVLQELVPLAYDYDRFGTRVDAFLADVRARLRERGADLMADAVRRMAAGTASRQAQDLSVGRRYRLPTHAEQDELRRRLRARRAAAHPVATLRGAQTGGS